MIKNLTTHFKSVDKSLEQPMEDVANDVVDVAVENVVENGAKRRKVKLEDRPIVRTNSEIVAFQKKHHALIWSGCTAAGMPRSTGGKRGEDLYDHDREYVESRVLLRYATGSWNYDPSRGTSESTYVFTVARREALNYLYRQPHKRFEAEVEDEDWGKFGDSHEEFDYSQEDSRLVAREALARLSRECPPKELELLVRYVLVERPHDLGKPGEKREYRAKLAKEYGYKNADSLSVIRNRWLPRLRAHVRNVLIEDNQGRLELSSNYDRISFLKPYLEWL